MRLALAAIVVLVLLILAPPGTVSAAEVRPSERPGRLTPNQLLAGRALTPAEAAAACGPAAAVAFARAVGLPITLDAAVAEARKVGWTPTFGMTGPYGQWSLLKRLNVPATVEPGLDVQRITREVQAGRPVIIRTSGQGPSVPGHYFVAERFDPATGRFDLAQSALVLRSAGERRWFALDEIVSLGTGRPTHAIYLASGARAVTLAAASARPFTPLASTSSRAPAGALVVETGGPGARLRAAPNVAAPVVGSLVDGARVTTAGASLNAGGRTWRQVSLAGGQLAWIDAGLLRPS